MSPEEYIYRKILKDVEKYITEDRLKNKINYVDDNGIETETIFEVQPTPEQLEGFLLLLNKDKIPYVLVEAIGDYKVLEEEEFLRMLK